MCINIFQQNILNPSKYSAGVTPGICRLFCNSGRLCDHEPVQNKDKLKNVLNIILFTVKNVRTRQVQISPNEAPNIYLRVGIVGITGQQYLAQISVHTLGDYIYLFIHSFIFACCSARHGGS